MIENGCYWFSDNEADWDEGDRDQRGGRGGGGLKPQFINYSWVWKDNLWSIIEVTLMSRSEGQIQEYMDERIEDREGDERSVSHQ